jgi:hypothetical protein
MTFMCFPHVLKKAQAAVDEVVGRERLPNFDDVGQIPYISAMIREAFRYTIDQGSPCPLATLNPFGRELLLSDVSTGFKRST